MGQLNLLTEAQTFSIAAIPQTGSGTYTMPDGYRRVAAIRFDSDFSPSNSAHFKLSTISTSSFENVSGLNAK